MQLESLINKDKQYININVRVFEKIDKNRKVQYNITKTRYLMNIMVRLD